MKDKQAVYLGGILFLSAINFIYVAWFFEAHRYLPPPFFYDVNDTFMDFYNTLYWSGHEGIYDIWRSVYPPLNFLLLKTYQFLFFDEVSEMWDPSTIRGLEAGNIIPLILIYTVCLIIAVSISFKSIMRLKIQFIIFLIFLLSPAFLFAVERGNLIILCLPVLSWYIFNKNQISRALALAILINLKPYFIIFYMVQLLNYKSQKENKDFLFLSPIFALIIFFSSGLLFKEHFYLIPLNLLGFATNSSLISPAEALAFPSTITAFSYFRGLVTEFSVPPIFGHLSKLIVYIYLIKIFILIYKQKINFKYLAMFSIIFLTNYSTSTGGYSLLYYIPALALLYEKRDWAILGIIIICFYIGLWDMVPIYNYSGGSSMAFLSGEVVKTSPYISLGSIIRPLANFAVLVLFFYRLEKVAE